MTAVPQPTDDEVHRFANRDFSRFGWQHRVYCVPVDQREHQRFDALDGMVKALFQREVFGPFPPPRDDDDSSDSLPAVLDCGFGGGGWIDRVLEEYQGNLDVRQIAKVTGVDIFLGQDDDEDDSSEEGNGNGNGNGVDPVQEYVKKRWNLNASFREDRSSDRLRPETFDLINSRYLAEGINTNRWSSYVRELRQLLKRGGWLQMVEIQFPFQSSNGTLPDDSYLTRWWQWYSYALQRMGKNVRVGQTLAEIMTTEGFQHVRPVMRDLPVGDWSSDPPNIGPGNLLIADRLLQSLSLYPFLQGEQMSQDAYRTLVNGARAELRNPAYRLYYRIYVAVGQRPP